MGDSGGTVREELILLVANVGLFLLLTALAFSLSQRATRRVRAFVGVLIAALSLPAVLYSLYYLHWFDDWLSFYRLRSYALANFYPASLGFLAGWLLPFRTLRLATIMVLVPFAIVPFIKPLIVPLHAQQLQDRWVGPVCLQSTPSTCGPAAVATILAGGFNDRVNERDIAHAARSTSTGTEIWYLAQFLHARGYRVTYHHCPTPIPYSIAGTHTGGAGHFVAVLGCNNGSCQVADPLSGFLPDPHGVAFNGFYMKIERENLDSRERPAAEAAAAPQVRLP
jgi:hypothetical protein